MYGLNPQDASDSTLDVDGDGLTNLEEFQYNTDPNKTDTDGDGLSDNRELILGTDPANNDSDGNGHPDSVLWSQDFSIDDSGFWYLPPGYMTVQNGRLVVTTQNVPNIEWAGAWGARLQNFGDGIVFRSEVTTGSDPRGRYLVIGAESDSALGAYRRHAADFEGDSVYVSYYDNGWKTEWLGTVKNDTTYIVDVITHATGTTLYVYEKDLSRDSGYVDVRTFTDWNYAQTFIEALGYLDPPSVEIYVDNLVEQYVTDEVANGLITEPPQRTILWREDFNQWAFGLSPIPSGYMTVANGHLVITGQDTSWNWPKVWGTRNYVFRVYAD